MRKAASDGGLSHWSGLLLVDFEVEGDFDFVAEHGWDELGAEAEVGALDGGGGGKAADQAAVAALLRWQGMPEVQALGMD